MKFAACLFTLVPIITAATLERVGPYIVTNEVYVNGAGPFRMLVDTGAQSCALTEEAAQRARVSSVARVEQVTSAGQRLTPAGRATITLDQVTADDAEVLIGGVDGLRSLGVKIDGVLGQSFLLGLDYLIDVRRRVLLLTVPPPDGTPIPLDFVDRRPAVRVEVSGKSRLLALDSGAPALVLFQRRADGLPPRSVSTNAGTIVGTCGTESVRIEAKRPRRLPAVSIPAQHRAADGLLPLSFFDSVYIGSTERIVIFDGR